MEASARGPTVVPASQATPVPNARPVSVTITLLKAAFIAVIHLFCNTSALLAINPLTVVSYANQTLE